MTAENCSASQPKPGDSGTGSELPGEPEEPSLFARRVAFMQKFGEGQSEPDPAEKKHVAQLFRSFIDDKILNFFGSIPPPALSTIL